MSKKSKVILSSIVIFLIIGIGIFSYLVYTGKVKLRASEPITSTSLGWQPPQTISGAKELLGIRGFGNDVWVCGNNSNNQGIVAHYNGSNWSNAQEIVGAGNLIGIRGNNNDIWVCGNNSNNQGIVAHYNGSNWDEAQIISNSNYFTDIQIVGNEIWACGELLNTQNGVQALGNGIVSHYNGSTWSQAQAIPGTNYLSSITTGAGNDDVWVCGSNNNQQGIVSHYNGSTWITQIVPELASAQGISGVGNDLWVCGRPTNSYNDSIVKHYDGSQWATVKTIVNGNLKSIRGFGNNTNIWVCGNTNLAPNTAGYTKGLVALISPATKYEVKPLDEIDTLSDITDGPNDDIWVCGNNYNSQGVVVHYTKNPVTQPSYKYNFSVRAKAVCYNGCPKMKIIVDGKQIADVEVKNTSAYTNYYFTYTSTSKLQRFDVNYYNDNGPRKLLIDSITFNGRKIGTCENIRVNYWIPSLGGSTKCGLKVPQKSYTWNKDPMGMAWYGVLQFFLNR